MSRKVAFALGLAAEQGCVWQPERERRSEEHRVQTHEMSRCYHVPHRLVLQVKSGPKQTLAAGFCLLSLKSNRPTKSLTNTELVSLWC